MLRKISAYLSLIFHAITKDSAQVERTEKYFDAYKREVLGDLRVLERIVEMSPYEFERESDHLYCSIKQQYSGTYCPSHLEPYFTFDQQTEYFWLRQEIDRLLCQHGPEGI